jgi:hypothetical protein
VTADFGQRMEAFGKAIVHPLLSHTFEDSLSAGLIRSSASLAWNIVASGALLSFVALALPADIYSSAANPVIRRALITYAVVGSLWGAFAAFAHSASSGRYARGLLLFAVWPLSFAYNWREAVLARQARRMRTSKSQSAVSIEDGEDGDR